MIRLRVKRSCPHCGAAVPQRRWFLAAGRKTWVCDGCGTMLRFAQARGARLGLAVLTIGCLGFFILARGEWWSSVPLGTLLVISLPLLLVFERVIPDQAHPSTYCPRCRYDLAGLAGGETRACPECGTSAPEGAFAPGRSSPVDEAA